MITNHILFHGLFYAMVSNAYLFVMMISNSQRVWGYSDYPDHVKAKVEKPTTAERRTAIYWEIPFLLFNLIFPFYSTYFLKTSLGGEIQYWLAFLNFFVMINMNALIDLIILDWLLISKLTPPFVIIPGSVEADYKDFSHHYKGHLRAALIFIPLSMIIAALVTWI